MNKDSTRTVFCPSRPLPLCLHCPIKCPLCLENCLQILLLMKPAIWLFLYHFFLSFPGSVIGVSIQFLLVVWYHGSKLTVCLFLLGWKILLTLLETATRFSLEKHYPSRLHACGIKIKSQNNNQPQFLNKQNVASYLLFRLSFGCFVLRKAAAWVYIMSCKFWSSALCFLFQCRSSWYLYLSTLRCFFFFF